jgi:PKD repeat protein
MKSRTLMCTLLLFALLVFPNVMAQDTSGTDVGGILNENTTWTIENSPYTVTETIQIPDGVTLTIEPGVEILFSGTDDIFLVHGSVIAQGTSDNRIVLDGKGVAECFFGGEGHADFFDLEFCVIKNGNKLFQAGASTTVILRHSEIYNVTEPSGLSTTHGENYIEYNFFSNSAGFLLLDFWELPEPGVTNYIRYNLVQNNPDLFVKATTNDLDTEIAMNYNSFIDTHGILLEIEGNYVGIDATENYWGTTDTTLIDEMIYDGNDDIGCPGIVNYNPILTSPNPEAYSLPIFVEFSHSPNTKYANLTTSFDASTSFSKYSNISSYSWSFGDGNTKNQITPNVTHTYAAAGQFNVNLTVTDDYGFKNTTIKSITVLADNTAPITSHNYNGEWKTSDFTITLSASDSESGVAETYYKVNGGSNRSLSSDGQPQTTLESENNTLEFWSVDIVGNIESVQVVSEIKLDKTDPVIGNPTTSPDYEVQAEETVKVTVDVSDSVSGVDQVILSYSTDNGSSWNDVSMNLNSTLDLWEAEIPGQELWTKVNYKITANDNAGNSVTSNGTELNGYDVVPEFPTWMVPLTLIAITLVAVIVKKEIDNKTEQKR